MIIYNRILMILISPLISESIPTLQNRLISNIPLWIKQIKIPQGNAQKGGYNDVHQIGQALSQRGHLYNKLDIFGNLM